jgi:phage terminase large subunit-like protein
LERIAVEAPVSAVELDLSCTDWAERLRAGRSMIRAKPVNPREGDRAVRIFNKLRLADVPGTPTMEEAGGEWFREIVRALFGSLDPVTRARLIREVFLLVAKKNSKTTNGSLLMLTALLMNERPNGTMIMTAPVQDVAQLAFDAAAGAIALDPVLEKILHVRDHLKRIVHRETKTELQIMTFDPSVLTGQKPIAVLIDELHVVAKMSKAPSAIRQIRGGMLPYPEAFLAFITTQSEEAPAGVFKAELDQARAIRDGERRGATLPVLYEFPPVMQRDQAVWRNPANWPMVTPNAGRSISIDRLVGEMATAEAKGEAELRAWASQHLNIEIGLALRSDSWVGADFWESCAVPVYDLDEMLARSEVVTFGIDGGGLDDLLGCAAIGREKETGIWLHWAHAWAHPIALERHKQEQQRFRDFEKAGALTIVEDPGQDITDVCDIVDRIEKACLLERIGVDPIGVGVIVDELLSRGIKMDRIVGISQGFRLTGAIKTTERKLAEKGMVHPNSPLMSWCVGNAKVEPRGNAILITRLASGNGKIDPLMATFSAVSLMALNPAPKRKKLVMFTVGGK